MLKKKYKRKRRKVVSVYFFLSLIIILCTICVGYSIFSTKLQIFGSVELINSSSQGGAVDKIINDHSNDGTLIQDGSEYYFNGSSEKVENYIIFENDYWRIIGIDSNGIKIQKLDPIGKMAWHTESKMQDWAKSSLNNYLNTTYWNSIQDKSDVVLNPIWNVGTSDDGLTISENSYYQGTSSDPRPIALVNVEEFSKAGGSDGWLLQDQTFWTITGSGKNNGTVYRFNSSGDSGNSNTTTENQIDPVLYLKSSTEFSGGDGSYNNPYTIA